MHMLSPEKMLKKKKLIFYTYICVCVCSKFNKTYGEKKRINNKRKTAFLKMKKKKVILKTKNILPFNCTGEMQTIDIV